MGKDHYVPWKNSYQRLKEINPGVWAAFVAFRRRLTEQLKMDARYAWLVAANEVGPDHLKPPEGLLVEAIKKHGLVPPEGGLVRVHEKLKALVEGKGLAAASENLPASDVGSGGSPSPSGASPGRRKPGRPSTGHQDAAIPSPAVPMATAAPVQVYDHATAKKMTVLEEVRWVAENAHVIEICRPEHTPTPAVWNLLVYARRSHDEFYRTFYPKLLPSRTQMEQEGLVQEGRVLDATILRVARAAEVASLKVPVDVLAFRVDGEQGWSARLVDAHDGKVLEKRGGFVDQDAALGWAAQRRSEFFQAPEMAEVGSVLG